MINFRFKTLQKGLLVCFSALFTVVLLLTFIFLYYYFSQNTYAQASDQHRQICLSISNAIGTEEDKMETISMNIVYSNLVKSHFQEYQQLFSDARDGDLNASYKKYENLNTLMDIIMAIIGPNMPVRQANIYDLHGEMVGSGLFNGEIKNQCRSMPWYKKTTMLKGEKYLSGPYPLKLLKLQNSAASKYIALTRVYLNSEGDSQGYIEIDQDCGTFFRFVNETISDNSDMRIFILNSGSKTVYPYNGNNAAEGRYYDHEIKGKQIKQLTLQTVQGYQNSSSQVLFYETLKNTGWTIIVVEPQRVLLKGANNLSRVFILVFLLVVIMTLIGSLFISRNVTNPLKRLNNSLKNNAIDNLSSGAGPIADMPGLLYIGEINELNHAFDDMNSKLKVSLNELLVSKSEENNAKVLAIQSQMNPHFLFNNLSIIHALSEEGENQKVIMLCGNLSFMLRYISSSSPNTVDFKEEIDYTQKYLDCIKIRFEDAISYTIDIDPALNNCPIPKLIIQPIVENAVRHGLKNAPPWRISIKGTICSTGWRVSVRDNGVGFSGEVLKELNAFFWEYRSIQNMPKLEIGGMGIKNIYLRLRSLYKEYAFFEIHRLEGAETEIFLGGKIEQQFQK